MFMHRSSVQLAKVASYLPHHMQLSAAPVVGVGPAPGRWWGVGRPVQNLRCDACLQMSYMCRLSMQL